MADEETRSQLEIDPAIGAVEMKITARARLQHLVLVLPALADRLRRGGEQKTKTRSALEYFAGKSLS